MPYSKHSLLQNNKKKFKSDWAFKEGVFLSPNGKYIARVLKRMNNYVTLSQHDTESEAMEVYQNFNKTK